jgi:alcohol dehydrogenase
MALAVKVTARGGTATIIGAPRPDVEIRINALDFVPSQRRILGCLTGNVRPNVDFDRFFRLFLRGRLPLDRLVTGTVPFEDIATGFEMNARAQGIRTVVHITPE